MRRKKVISIICTVALSMTMTGCGVLDELFTPGSGTQPIIVQQERLDESDSGVEKGLEGRQARGMST